MFVCDSKMQSFVFELFLQISILWVVEAVPVQRNVFTLRYFKSSFFSKVAAETEWRKQMLYTGLEASQIQTIAHPRTHLITVFNTLSPTSYTTPICSAHNSYKVISANNNALVTICIVDVALNESSAEGTSLLTARRTSFNKGIYRSKSCEM